MIRWSTVRHVVTVPAVTTWRSLARDGRWVLAWRLLPPALVIAVGLLIVPLHPLTVMGTLVAALAVLCRYAFPITALLVGAGLAVAASFEPSTALLVLPWPVSILLYYSVGRQVPRIRRAVAALAFATVAQAAASFTVLIAERGFNWEDAGFLLVAIALVAVLPCVIGMFRGERARAITALHERNVLLERANLLGETQARMQERAEIAREMHDLLGHRLSLIILHAGALELRTRGAEPEISRQADLLRTTSCTALDELRAVLRILRLDGSDRSDSTASAVGTRTDVTGLVAESRHAGLPVTLSWQGDDLTDTHLGIRLAVNRIVREALTNVHKHAPGAVARLDVTVAAEQIQINVHNELRPPAVSPPSTGLGLTGLRERARLAGGQVTAGTDPVTGDFTVTATLPVHCGGSDVGTPTIDHLALADRQMPAALRAAQAGSSLGTPRRSIQPMSRTKKVALSVVGVVVVLCGGLGVGGYYLFQQSVSPQTYEKIRTGDAQDKVRELTGGGTAVAREAVKANQPAPPPSTTCDYVLVDGFESVYRFCFKDGKLAQKDEIKTP